MLTAIKFNIKLINLYCYKQRDAGGDEVFLKFHDEQIWPLLDKYKSVDEGYCDVQVDIAGIDKGSHVEVELWDYDLLSPSDQLGTFTMQVNERGGPFMTDLQTDDQAAKYSLEWEVG